jgi:hypothetical protein
MRRKLVFGGCAILEMIRCYENDHCIPKRPGNISPYLTNGTSPFLLKTHKGADFHIQLPGLTHCSPELPDKDRLIM